MRDASICSSSSAQILGKSTLFVELNLAQNRIGDRGLVAISEYLRVNSSLRVLVLENVSAILFYASLTSLTGCHFRTISKEIHQPLNASQLL